jgi:hypothetical protein
VASHLFIARTNLLSDEKQHVVGQLCASLVAYTRPFLVYDLPAFDSYVAEAFAVVLISESLDAKNALRRYRCYETKLHWRGSVSFGLSLDCPKTPPCLSIRNSTYLHWRNK